ncbi:cystathionine beta-synthase, partial [Streptomyces eurythermus]
VVVLLPDSGRGYLSKIFNDEWMADYGFLEDETRGGRRGRSLPYGWGLLGEVAPVHRQDRPGDE